MRRPLLHGYHAAREGNPEGLPVHPVQIVFMTAGVPANDTPTGITCPGDDAIGEGHEAEDRGFGKSTSVGRPFPDRPCGPEKKPSGMIG